MCLPVHRLKYLSSRLLEACTSAATNCHPPDRGESKLSTYMPYHRASLLELLQAAAAEPQAAMLILVSTGNPGETAVHHCTRGLATSKHSTYNKSVPLEGNVHIHSSRRQKLHRLSVGQRWQLPASLFDGVLSRKLKFKEFQASPIPDNTSKHIFSELQLELPIQHTAFSLCRTSTQSGAFRTGLAWQCFLNLWTDLYHTDSTTMTIFRGNAPLSAVVCLACLTCSTVVAFVGPMSAAHSSLTRVNRNELATTNSVPRAPRCFTPGAIDFSDRTRAVATVALTAGASSNEVVTMSAGGSKKTAIITGASSGEDYTKAPAGNILRLRWLMMRLPCKRLVVSIDVSCFG